MSHTDTAPSVSPLMRYLPELHGNNHFGSISYSGFAVNKENLRVQVEVDALVGGNVPLQCKQNIVRLPQVPA